ncbi:MAG TPA: hypothetical protein VFS10_08920, partial [Pyrinomonadaceae bacterium]|nr:hypothetical protein [Pyrinomonadaceae bacterium]
GESFERPESITTVEIDPETGALATEACPQRERVAVTHALAPAHECLTHAASFDALATLDAGEIEDAAASVVERIVETQRALRHSVENTTRALSPARSATTNVQLEPRATRTTRVEVRRDGRPALTNEMRVAEKNADGWQR